MVRPEGPRPVAMLATTLRLPVSTTETLSAS
jgi:hypothetical protein